ncbi:MAG TPA: regulatory protein RecX [Solirubrobacteraceae bacterium]|nr:regulatory protein RecX [Solirubrobacteraceae bacterium]
MGAPDRVQDPAARLQHALDLAYHYVARHERTVLEVRRHLERKRVEPATIEAALGELIEQRYLDDVRYARVFTEDRRNLDGWGTERIERRLRAAGVPCEVVLEVLGERSHEDELSQALEILRRKLREPPADERARERALGLLVRRGYELDLAYSAVRQFEHG